MLYAAAAPFRRRPWQDAEVARLQSCRAGARFANIASNPVWEVAKKSQCVEHTIWGHLKRSLPIDGKELGRLGYATGVVSISRWIGEGILFIIGERPHKIVAQPDPLAAPLDRNRKDYGNGRVRPRQFLISPSIIRTYYYRSVVSAQHWTFLK